ncbi:hypothetical protein VB715_19455 [Crocosphaera sp. UHCC 0190]|uniref:hypothetical protein n=1 Tax=unclassified Crocosphaera TaxID=2623705 RepID=UPI002B20307E|nr:MULTISPECIES: hypothetical protein [unclassified Crocosphaera]MEA5511953.1 hypothetical protein [Crocosphaera sp. UHCC 0190]MEA5536679.1 hypothetical protein [Crocosphaera sp. XPORK-15E]
MLLEKSKQLIELSQRKIELQKYANNQQGFKSRQEQITEYYQQVIKVLEPLRLFRSKGLISVDFAPLVENLLNLVQLTVKHYQENPEWIIDNQNFNRSKFQSSINKLTSTIETQLLEIWKNYLKRKLPSTNSEFLNILDQIDQFKPTIQRIRQLEIQISSEEFPKYQERFDHIENLIQQLNDTWNTLNAENVPDEVLKFLKAAGSNTGASFNLLTPTVEAWIKEHRLSHTLRIHLS